MGILYVETLDDNLVYHGVTEPPNDFNGGWCFQAEGGSRSVWLSDDVVLSFEFEDEEGGGTEAASLKFKIDTSGISEATEEIAKLEKAVHSLAEAYDRLNDAQKGPVENSLDATDQLLDELMAGEKGDEVSFKFEGPDIFVKFVEAVMADIRKSGCKVVRV